MQDIAYSYKKFTRRYVGDFLDRYFNINNAANHNLRSNYPPSPPQKKQQKTKPTY